ncbi:MAG: DUF1287 domain-containing protein [Burkholderiales bacterium]|jgi:uncharacterized protein YijF (DUF1287 family)|nr:DUF1287 domain-containing protein [Burkholderiales bacterium]
MFQKIIFVLGLALCAVGVTATAQDKALVSDHAQKLIDAARAQIGVTLYYNGAYQKLSYPNGDVPQDRGVCTDVIIRAYRLAFHYDLQSKVHEDMSAHFSVYPKIWGLTRPDANIDHRRVPNLQKFFERHGASLPISKNPNDYQPGDMVTQMIGGKLPHIGIVSQRKSADQKRYLLIHNIGAGTQEEDALFSHPMTGHYRLIF